MFIGKKGLILWNIPTHFLSFEDIAFGCTQAFLHEYAKDLLNAPRSKKSSAL